MKYFSVLGLTASCAVTLFTAIRIGNAAAGEAPESASCSSRLGGGSWHPLLQESEAPDWRGWNSSQFPDGWHVSRGVLSKSGTVDDLVTKLPYSNFELEFEWKLSRGGNSGVFYRGTHEYEHIYWSAPEYQLLDDANAPDGKSALTSSGSAYGIYAPSTRAASPFDHWNKSRILVRGNHVEHWLNGREVVSYQLRGADWRLRVSTSKFASYPNYGLAACGSIGIQGDHSGNLSIRNIRIRNRS